MEKYQNFNSQPHKEADWFTTVPTDHTSIFQFTASQGGWPAGKIVRESWLNFNSQPHKEADERAVLQQRKNAYFNSQPHKEADSNVQADLRIEEYFNSQPHKEADYKSLANAKKEWNFNSQPHKEADVAKDGAIRRRFYFNSQPHKEADQDQQETINNLNISIHSLTRRLTLFEQIKARFKVFQFTASQGGWLRATNWIPVSENFNSQPHKEADLIATSLCDFYITFQFTASQGGWH